MVHETVTLGIPTLGNTHALLTTLSAVLASEDVPGRIWIRSEGPFPGFAHYYLEQLADVARQSGVEFAFFTCASKGLRGAVDWFLREIPTPYFWMLADDVMVRPRALRSFAQVILAMDEPWGYICGNKVDINNRRHWPDFKQTPVVPYDFCPTYGSYLEGGPIFVRNRLLDNSHAIFNREPLLREGLFETAFKFGYQSGGDDTLFGLRITQKMGGYFAPYSKVWHLEKESQNFNEPTARAEAILRQAQLLALLPVGKIPPEFHAMFPYTPKYSDGSEEQT